MADQTLTFTDATFEADVLNADEPVLVDFWAPWCGPCRAIAPIIEELAEEFEGRAKVGKVNFDENPETAARYRIRSIPTLLILHDGEVVDQVVGLTAKRQIAGKLEAVLDVPA